MMDYKDLVSQENQFYFRLNPASSERVGGLEEHATHATDVEDVIARAALTDVARGGGVRPTARAGLSQQSDEAVLAPGGAPAVPHNPEVSAVLGAISHKLDPVVKLDVGIIVAA